MISLLHSSGITESRAAMFWSIWYLFVAPTKAAVMNGLESKKQGGWGWGRREGHFRSKKQGGWGGGQ